MSCTWILQNGYRKGTPCANPIIVNDSKLCARHYGITAVNTAKNTTGAATPDKRIPTTSVTNNIVIIQQIQQVQQIYIRRVQPIRNVKRRSTPRERAEKRRSEQYQQYIDKIKQARNNEIMRRRID